MTVSPFDPTHAVRFDVAHGIVRAGREGDRVLLVPSGALDDLLRSAAPEAVEGLARALGSAIGRRAAARLDDPDAASPEAFLSQLAGEAAISGVGALSVERWGRALVVLVEDCPLGGAVLGPLVASALEAATGRKVSCTVLSRDERSARLLVASERAVARVREWISGGVAWVEAIAKLHGGGG
jgi:hypothetical protein